MGARNKLNFITSAPSYIITFIKKLKFDNFVGGLVFGAIFSIVVNIFTVKVQEDIAKQRTLEALEMGMTATYR